jgi:hypothetical protein
VKEPSKHETLGERPLAPASRKAACFHSPVRPFVSLRDPSRACAHVLVFLTNSLRGTKGRYFHS